MDLNNGSSLSRVHGPMCPCLTFPLTLTVLTREAMPMHFDGTLSQFIIH